MVVALILRSRGFRFAGCFGFRDDCGEGAGSSSGGESCGCCDGAAALGICKAGLK